MCRNIKQLYNFVPPANKEEIEASALQFVRKVTGMNKPSKENEAVFDQAVIEVTSVVNALFSQLQTKAPAKNREVEALKAKERNQKRFGR